MAFTVNGTTLINDPAGSRTLTTPSITINSDSPTTFIQVSPSSPLAGTNAGFVAGGGITSSYVGTIDRFPFATDTNATNVGTLTRSYRLTTGQSSQVHGYTAGGYMGPPFSGNSAAINRYNFATVVTSISTGSLVGTHRRSGAGASSDTYGYVAGGNSGPTAVNPIGKFSFSSIAPTTAVGTLSIARAGAAGMSSTTYGYVAGGYAVPPGNTSQSNIEKFSFTTDGNGASVGALTSARRFPDGNSSPTNGYSSGGVIATPAPITNIEKFPFASDTNASNIASLTTAGTAGAGSSSVGYGYVSGSNTPAYSTTIQKYTFATDTNATSVGALSGARGESGGAQD
jgi:hypothetical protein